MEKRKLDNKTIGLPAETWESLREIKDALRAKTKRTVYFSEVIEKAVDEQIAAWKGRKQPAFAVTLDSIDARDRALIKDLVSIFAIAPRTHIYLEAIRGLIRSLARELLRKES